MALLSRVRRWHWLSAGLVLTALWLLFFWRLWTPTAADRVLFDKGDFSLHYYAFSTYQAERLQAGQIPLWNPYNYGGEPFAANVQWVTWYPLRWAAIGLAGAGGWSIEALQWEVAAHYWLVSVLLYGFLGALVTQRRAALIGSLLFTYGGYLTGYPLLQVSIIESAAWLPLLFWGVQHAISAPTLKAGRWGLTAGGVALGLSFLAGHPQTTLQMLYAALAYGAFLGWQRRARWWQVGLRLSLVVLLGVGLAAVQLVPALEFIRLSSRSAYSYVDKAHGMALVDSFAAVFPGLFGPWSPLYSGIAALGLVGAGLLRWWQGASGLKQVFWLGLIVVGLLWALGGASIFYDLVYLLLPAMNTFRQQERSILLVSFAVTVLATLTLDDVLNAEPTSLSAVRRVTRWWALLLGAVAGFGVVLGLLNGEYVTDSAVLNRISWAALLALGVATWAARWPKGAALLGAVVVLDLFTVGTRSPNFVPDTPALREAPPAFSDVLRVPAADIRWQVDGAAGVQGRGTGFRIPDIYGTGPFALAAMDALRTLPVDRFWEILAVRYVTTAAEPPASVPLKLLGYAENYDGQPYQLFELTAPRPFAQLVYAVRVAEGNPVFARQIMSDARVNLREMAVTTQALPFELGGERPPDALAEVLERPTPEVIKIAVRTSANALLTLPLPYYPGWEAQVNGVPVPLVETYTGLIGVPLAAGTEATVLVRFVPRSVTLGAALTIGTALLWAGALGGGLVRRRSGIV